MKTLNAMTFLKLMNQTSITTEKVCNLRIGHGYGFFRKPFLVAKLRELLRYVAINADNTSDVEPIKGVPNGMGGASSERCDLVRVQPLFVLRGKPPFIVKKVNAFLVLAKVFSYVAPMRKHNKVFNSVVKFVTVDVMNSLPWEKITAKMLFHYKAMLIDVLSWSEWVVRRLNSLIPSRVRNAIAPLPMVGAFVWDGSESLLLSHGRPPMLNVSVV